MTTRAVFCCIHWAAKPRDAISRQRGTKAVSNHELTLHNCRCFNIVILEFVFLDFGICLWVLVCIFGSVRIRVRASGNQGTEESAHRMIVSKYPIQKIMTKSSAYFNFTYFCISWNLKLY